MSVNTRPTSGCASISFTCRASFPGCQMSSWSSSATYGRGCGGKTGISCSRHAAIGLPDHGHPWAIGAGDLRGVVGRAVVDHDHPQRHVLGESTVQGLPDHRTTVVGGKDHVHQRRLGRTYRPSDSSMASRPARRPSHALANDFAIGFDALGGDDARRTDALHDPARAVPIASRCDGGIESISEIAAANASGSSGGTTSPARASVTSSATPTRSVTMHGRPHAIASRTALGYTSFSDGRTKTAQAWYSGTSSGWGTGSRNRADPSAPRSLSISTSNRRMDLAPGAEGVSLPTNWNSTPGCWAFTDGIAAASAVSPFRRCRCPTNRTRWPSGRVPEAAG